MTTTTALTCEQCGATGGKNGKAFTRGSLNLHKAMHCPKKQGGGSAQMKCCENPSIRFLRKDDPRELWAMEQGMKTLCVNCEECS